MEMKLRTVQSAYREIKAADPETAVTEYLIRQIVYGGAIPTIKSGNKRLFSMDALLHYLEGKRA